MRMFPSEADLKASLAQHDELVRQCAHGEITWGLFCDRYNNYWSYYALDGHESDEEENALLDRYEDRIELHRAIAFDVLGQVCSEEDSVKDIYIQAGRIGAAAAVERIASLWAEHRGVK
jgi:hypothetical protein